MSCSQMTRAGFPPDFSHLLLPQTLLTLSGHEVTTTMTSQVLLHPIRYADVPCVPLSGQLTGLLSPF